jgi:hypothetical protein
MRRVFSRPSICPAGDQRPRKLKDGSLLLGYSEFVGSDSSDFAQARIAGKIGIWLS